VIGIDQALADAVHLSTEIPGPLKEYRDAMARQLATEIIGRIVASRRLGPFHPLPWFLGRLWINGRL
jgi:hypothetical protein